MISHCTEGALLAILDGQLIDSDRTAHLESCAECGQRFRELASEARLVGKFIRESGSTSIDRPQYDTDFLAALGRGGRAPARVGWSMRYRYIAVAAGLALLLLVPPVRAWVRSATGLFGIFGDPEVVLTAPGEGESGKSTVSISLTSPALRLVLRGEPASVTLVAAEQGVESARLTVAFPTAVTALPDGFMLDRADGAEIRVAVPASIESVQLAVDGVVVWAGGAPRPFGDGWAIPLHTR